MALRNLPIHRFAVGEDVPDDIEERRQRGECIVVVDGTPPDLTSLKLKIVQWLASLYVQNERPPPERPPPA